MAYPFFIVGAQRSGSTLLRLILNAHSEIAIPEEARFLTPLLDKKYLKEPFRGKRLEFLIEYISKVPHFKLWNYDSSFFLAKLRSKSEITLREFIEELYSSYCEYEGKKYWGDKSLFFNWIEVLYTLFPEARFIHIVRDGRDVFNSWRKIEPSMNNVAVAALDWSYKLSRIERAFVKIPRSNSMTVRYEDLLSEPEKTVRAICDFINISYEPQMLEFYKTSQYYIGKHHSKLIFGPLRKDNCYKWRKELTEREKNIFTFLAKKTLAKYQYDTNCPLRFSDLIFSLLYISYGIPKRLWQILSIRWILREAIEKGDNFDESKYKSLPVGLPPAKKK